MDYSGACRSQYWDQNSPPQIHHGKSAIIQGEEWSCWNTRVKFIRFLILGRKEVQARGREYKASERKWSLFHTMQIWRDLLLKIFPQWQNFFLQTEKLFIFKFMFLIYIWLKACCRRHWKQKAIAEKWWEMRKKWRTCQCELSYVLFLFSIPHAWNIHGTYWF